MKLSKWLGCLMAIAGVGVANAAVVGGKVDSAGSAKLVSGAVVTLRSAGGGGGTTLRDTTGAEGTYSFPTVAAGVYTLSVSATGYTTKSVTDTVTEEPSTVDVSLVAVVVSSVSGKVDSAGSAKLVSGAIVTLRLSAGGGGATTFRDTTGEDGTYSFANVTAGIYTIGVSATGYTTRSVTDTVTAEPSTANVSLVAIIVSTVSGKVDSAGSATAVGGAIVTLRLSAGGGGATTFRDTTGEDGTYSFANVTAGIYTIGVSATGYTTRSVTDTVTAEPSTANVSLVAVIVSTVGGKVDSAGSATAIGGAIVTLTRSGGGGTTVRDTTAADGTYSFANVTAGTYTISVSATGYTTRSVTDTVTAEPSTANVSLVAIIVSTVSGKVDSAGSPKLVSGAVVTLRISGGGGGATTFRDTTGADGTYSFANVTAGIYTIGVSAAGYTTRSVTDTVTAEPSTVNVSLVATIVSTVSGKVDSAGSPKLVSGAVVTLRISGGGGGATTFRDTTGADGTYSFANVTAGIYTIGVSAAGYTTRSVTDTVTAEPSTVNVSLVASGQTKIITQLGTVSDASFANGILKLTNMNSEGSVRLMNAKGELVVIRYFQPGANVNLQIGRKLSAGNYIVRITQNDVILQKWMVVQ